MEFDRKILKSGRNFVKNKFTVIVFYEKFKKITTLDPPPSPKQENINQKKGKIPSYHLNKVLQGFVSRHTNKYSSWKRFYKVKYHPLSQLFSIY